MKYYETTFDEYLNESKKNNLHPKLDEVIDNIPHDINKLTNIIIYGPVGIGKYTMALKIIKKYSNSNLKYEKKMYLEINNNEFKFKISDIHVEIDMNVLGCNSKTLWNEIFNNLKDIAIIKKNYTLIILCKNFHSINSELLDNFYSYMQSKYYSNIRFKFFLITSHLSFIPNNILNICKIINIGRPTKSLYKKCLNKNINCNLRDINNIKNIRSNNIDIMTNYKLWGDKLIEIIIDYNNIDFYSLRNILYNILIYNINFNKILWYLLITIPKKTTVKINQYQKILNYIYIFFKYYNNNYRPIYHLERIILNIIKVVNNLDE